MLYDNGKRMTMYECVCVCVQVSVFIAVFDIGLASRAQFESEHRLCHNSLCQQQLKRTALTPAPALTPALTHGDTNSA